VAQVFNLCGGRAEGVRGLRAMGLLCDLGAGRGEAGRQASKQARRKQSNIKQIT
jgi:hypothetical protein